MKKLLSIVMAALFAGSVFSIVIPTNADAVPSFARQIEAPCFQCHFQYFPKLNSFGRAFKAGGATDAGVDLLEGDINTAVSMVSAVVEFEYKDYEPRVAPATETGANRGQWIFPEEIAPWFAGRLSENWGVTLEHDGAGRLVFATGETTTFGVTTFYTDAHGPAWGMELFNTGVVKHMKPAMGDPAPKTVHLSKDVVGIGVYANNDMGFVNLAGFVPSNGEPDAGLDLTLWYRAAFTPALGDWDTMIGVWGSSGDTEISGGTSTLTNYETSAFGIDAQLQGAVGGTSVGFYFNSVLDTGSASSTKVQTLSADTTVYSIHGDFGFNNDLVGVGFNYNTKDGPGSNDEDVVSLTGWWNPTVPVGIHARYDFISGDGRSHENKFVVKLVTAL